MSTGLYVHSAPAILDLNVLGVIRFALRRLIKAAADVTLKFPGGRARDSLKTL